MEVADLQADVESVSVFYAERHGIDRTDEWFKLKLGEEVGEPTQAHLARSGQARNKRQSEAQVEQHFRTELADVLAQVLLIPHRFDVDSESEVERKWLVWKPADRESS